MADWHVELESSLPGSQRIRSIIKLPSDPHTRGAIVGAITTSIIFLFKEAAAWGVGEVMDYIKGPDAPEEVQVLSDEEMSQIAEDVVGLLRTGTARSEAGLVYEALEKDRKVVGAGSTSNREGKPSRVVRRDQFPLGHDTELEEEPEQRTTTEQIELTLIRPILSNDTSRRWGFQSKYGAFGAPIKDQAFLNAMADGALDLPMAEGIQMVVEIEISEEREGQVWRPTDRIITRVIEVKPPPKQTGFDLQGP
ncbi:hypothetical protein [Tranquillimonas rosea]|nr:hypothetical protein [Tranquillimonas rosea]